MPDSNIVDLSRSIEALSSTVCYPPTSIRRDQDENAPRGDDEQVVEDARRAYFQGPHPRVPRFGN